MISVQGMMERTAAIIIDIIEKHGLSNSRLACTVGCGKNTIRNFRKLVTPPSTEIIFNLSDNFNVNVEWLYSGQGNPYYEEGMSPGEPLGLGGAAQVEYALAGETDLDEADGVATPRVAYGLELNDELSSHLAMAARVMGSKSRYGKVLYQNIELMYEALMVKGKTIRAQFDLERTRSQMASFEKRRKGTGAGRTATAPDKKREAGKTRAKSGKGSTARESVKSKGRKSGKTGKPKEPRG